MTKSDLIYRMCETLRVPIGRAEDTVNAIFGAIEQALDRGERIEIRGFGSFEVRDYRGYTGRNPRTGSTVEVKPKRLAFFKVGKELKDRVQSSARPIVSPGRLSTGSHVDDAPGAKERASRQEKMVDSGAGREATPVGVEGVMGEAGAEPRGTGERPGAVSSIHQQAMVAKPIIPYAPTAIIIRPSHG